jgi:hypothetical protein
MEVKKNGEKNSISTTGVAKDSYLIVYSTVLTDVIRIKGVKEVSKRTIEPKMIPISLALFSPSK